MDSITKGAPASEKNIRCRFFFNTSLAELTDYVIRHISKYSNIMSSLSSNSAGFCPNSASLSLSEALSLRDCVR